MRKNKSKAFTLVELMIVISIIWVLAVTLLPKLQWAQARSRDAGRIASVTSVEAVLNTYFSDEWQYPRFPSSQTAGDSINTSAWNWCLSTSDWSIHPKIEWLFTWSKAPLDPHKNNMAAYCQVGWSIGYHSLTKDWIIDNSYLLITNVESYQKANYNMNSTPIPKDGTTPYDNVKGTTYWTWWKLTSENADALKSVYAIIN